MIPLTGEEAARTNLRVARESVATAGLLALLKLGAALVTGSLSIVASLVDSLMDVMASSGNLVAVRVAGQPADEDHAYGHGKAEGLAGLAQGVVVTLSGLFVLGEGVRRLVVGEPIQRTGVGIGVMVVSMAASVWIARRLQSTARRTGSVALAADRVHYTSDIWTNLGVLLALAATGLTGWTWVDPLVALLVAVVILRTAVVVVRRSADELMDKVLPEEDVQRILAHVRQRVPEVRGIHDVRTRRAGPTVFVDLHVQLDRSLSFVEAHRLSERVVRAVGEARPGAAVHVHADPWPPRPEDLE